MARTCWYWTSSVHIASPWLSRRFRRTSAADVGRRDLDAGFIRKCLADHEIAIAVHEEHRHTLVDELADRRFICAVVGVRVIVADPGLEQVAQNIQRVRLRGGPGEEGQKLLADLRAGRARGASRR